MVATSSIGPGATEHGHRRRRGDGQPAARAAALRATRSRAGSPIPCCSRSSTSARPRRPVNDAFRAGHALLGPDHAPGAGRAVAAARASRRCSTRPTAARPSSACRRTSRPRRTTTPCGCSSRGVHTIAPAAARRARARRRGRRALRAREASADRRRRRRPLLARRGRARGASPRRTTCPSSRPSRASRRLTADHPCYVGPIGVTGCDQANRLAAEADVVLAVGHPAAGLHDRLVDGVRQRGAAHRSGSTPRGSTPPSTARCRSSATPARALDRARRGARRLAAPTRRGPRRAQRGGATLPRARSPRTTTAPRRRPRRPTRR